jgi:hypothetical protein
MLSSSRLLLQVLGQKVSLCPALSCRVLVKVAIKIRLFQYIERPQQSHNALQAGHYTTSQ